MFLLIALRAAYVSRRKLYSELVPTLYSGIVAVTVSIPSSIDLLKSFLLEARKSSHMKISFM
jgi:hypothetical protein